MAIQNFEQQAREAAQQEIDNRYRDTQLSNQDRQFAATQELNRQLALGQIDGQSTLEGREFIYDQSQDAIANEQRQQTIDNAMTVARANGKELKQQADGSWNEYDPFTGEVQRQVIGPDPYLLQQNSLRGGGGGGGAIGEAGSDTANILANEFRNTFGRAPSSKELNNYVDLYNFEATREAGPLNTDTFFDQQRQAELTTKGRVDADGSGGGYYDASGNWIQ